MVMMGILIWVVPFLASFAFYDRMGKLSVSEDGFKSIMVVISTSVGMYALGSHFRSIKNNYFREGIVVGIVWLVINLLLDMIILVPVAKMQMKDYLMSIGLRYLQIPVISIALGAILQRKIFTLQKS
jgi:uncharacterized membrane protein YpjA